MNLELPIHPTLRHPLTGEPLQAVYVTRKGHVKWPIMGAAEGDDAAAQAAAEAAAAADAAAASKAAEDAAAKAAADAAAKGADADKDLGFPKDTPVASMTLAQQVAYHKHQARKHETRATEYREAAGGKTAEEIKADLEAAAELRRKALSDQERAVEDARNEGRTAATSELGPAMVRTAFDLLLGDMPEEKRNEEMDLLDLSKFLTEKGAVDTAKVKAHAQKIAPAGKGPGERRLDFDGGDRGGNGQGTGVAAGRELFKSRRGKSSTTTTT